jgi:hypothetical protein
MRAFVLNLVILAGIATSACNKAKEKSPTTDNGVSSRAPTPTLSITAIPLDQRVIILVPGWGPALVTNMKDLRMFFEKKGVPNDRIFELTYSYRSEFAVIKADLEKQYLAIFQKFPGAEAAVITHSLGGFAAIYALMKSNLSNHVDTYIQLAGVAHGQTEPPPGCVIESICGPATMQLYSDKAFVDDFYKTYEAEVAKLKKCSLYSPQDGMAIKPYDSGAFSDGINISLPDVKHLSFLHDEAVFERMKKDCGL